MPRPVLIPILAAALLTACGKPASQTPAADQAAAPAAGDAPALAPTPGAPTAHSGFDPAALPESTVALPPFPFFKPLDGLASVFDEKDRFRNFDVEYFVTGTRATPVEGRVYRDIFPLEGEHRYTPLEFQRNFEQAVTALGGVKIAGPVQTEAFFNQRPETPAPNGSCWQFNCDAAFYLIRQDGKEYWISVGTASIPLHGYVTVAERQAMKASFAFLDANALKAALDANGRVPVYVEFDLDRATLRPGARPAVDEIIKLMRQHPELKVSVEGHTDDTGTAERNRTLSLERANTVQGALLAAGISAGRMKTAGFGADRPLAPNTSDDGRARNRRVELVRLK